MALPALRLLLLVEAIAAAFTLGATTSVVVELSRLTQLEAAVTVVAVEVLATGRDERFMGCCCFQETKQG
jgi:hypothetical protein